MNQGVVEFAPLPNSYLHMIEGEIENHGVVQGGGFLEASDFVNEPGGLVSIGAGETLTADVDAFVNLGTVDVAAGGTVTFEGVVSGDGIFTGAGTKNFLGGIEPGTSPGTLGIGGAAVIGQNADVVLEIAGSAVGSYDHIEFDDVTIGGGCARDPIRERFCAERRRYFRAPRLDDTQRQLRTRRAAAGDRVGRRGVVHGGCDRGARAGRRDAVRGDCARLDRPRPGPQPGSAPSRRK